MKPPIGCGGYIWLALRTGLNMPGWLFTRPFLVKPDGVGRANLPLTRRSWYTQESLAGPRHIDGAMKACV